MLIVQTAVVIVQTTVLIVQTTVLIEVFNALLKVLPVLLIGFDCRKRVYVRVVAYGKQPPSILPFTLHKAVEIA